MMRRFIRRRIAERWAEEQWRADRLRLLTTLQLLDTPGKKLADRLDLVERTLLAELQILGGSEVESRVVTVGDDGFVLSGLRFDIVDMLKAVRAIREAIISGDAVAAVQATLHFAHARRRAGSMQRLQDYWDGRKCREAAPTGARERDRETVETRHAKWRDFAASKPTWSRNYAAERIAEAEGVKPRTVRAVLYRERGTRK